MESPTRTTKSSRIIQNINFTELETECSTKVVGQHVTVTCNTGNHSHGSSKVKLINKIDYNWEMHYYRGQLVAVHINGKIVAYGMKGKDGGMVRVTNQETGDRALIKNLRNDVRDVAFAFSKKDVILGCIDDEGNVRIYEIIDKPGSIIYNLLLHIIHNSVSSHNSTNFRIIWCPYLPCYEDEDIDSSDDPEKMFVVLNNTKAEIWNYGVVNSKYGNGMLEPNTKYDGYIEINHSGGLIDASFSSDGTAIAVASVDGYVKFFQIFVSETEKAKCLHQWRPHEGSPLSSIIFVDNLLAYSSQCWKFTITGANHNSELKLWSCETWNCLQTIHFKPEPTTLIPEIFLKISIDYTGQYLVMSDLNNKVLYVLQLERNDQAQEISVTMLSQFLLPTAFLSFHITEATIRKLRHNDLSSSEDYINDHFNYPDDDIDLDDDDDEDEDALITANVLKLLVIQPKKFQECNIVFQPDSMLCNSEIIYEDVKQQQQQQDVDDVVQVQDLLQQKQRGDVDDDDEDDENNEKNVPIPKLDDLQSSVTLLIQQQQQPLNLMTPDAFTTPSVVTTTQTTTTVTNDDENTNRPNSATLVVVRDLNKSNDNDNSNKVENLIDFQRPEKDNFASGGSSPSREVQEIFSLNNSTYSTQDYYENLNKSEHDIPQKDYIATNENLYQTSSTSDNQNNDVAAWLKMPSIVNENDVVVGGGKDDNLRKAAAVAAATVTITDDNKQQQVINLNDSSSTNTEWTKKQVQTINIRLDTLQSALDNQNLILQKLHQEIKILNQNKNNNNNTNNNTTEQFIKEIEVAMSKQYLQTAQMLETVINMNKKNICEQQDEIIKNVSQMVSKNITDKMQNVIAHEMKHVVTPTIRSLVEALKHQLDLQNSQRISSDLALHDKISKLINSKAISDSLIQSIPNIITPILEKCYKDMITSNLVPSLERVCGNMFYQINETFTQGTKEYTASVENYMERQKRVQDKGKDLIAQMQSVSDGLQANAEKLGNVFTNDVHKQINNSLKHMQEQLISTIKEVVSDQVKIGFKNHASVLEDSVISAVRSRAVTPSPHVDTQVNLDYLIAKECYNEAIQLALSAENLNYVLYVCEKVDTNALFGGTSIPPQNCILALIQQLSMELHKNTDIKMNYIRAALVALVPNSPQTRHFIPKVLKDLLKQLQIFMTSNSSSKYKTDAKLLKMAVESILDK